MRMWVRQIYIKPGIHFPFSVHMQRWLSEELSSLATASPSFQKKYGYDFRLGVNLSADTQIADNLVKGPGVYKKTKDVEYTLFLPFDVIAKSPGGLRVALGFLLAGIRLIFQKAGVDPARLDDRKAFIIEHLCSDPMMLEEPWPYQ